MPACEACGAPLASSTAACPSCGRVPPPDDPLAALRAELVSGALLTGIVLALGLLAAVLSGIGSTLLGAGSPSPETASFGSSSSSGLTAGSPDLVTSLAGLTVQLCGMALFGGLRVSTSSGGASVFFVPIALTALIAAAVVVVTCRRAVRTVRESSLREARRAATVAVVPAGVVALLAGLMPVTQGTVSIAANPALVLVLGFVFVAAVGLAARIVGRAPIPDRAGWRASYALRRGAAAVLVHGAVATTSLLAVSLVAIVVQSGPAKALGAALLLPSVGANAIVAEVGLVHGGTVAASASAGLFSFSGSATLLSLSRWTLLLLVVPILGTVLAGLRAGTGTADTPGTSGAGWSDAWVLPVAFTSTWLVLFTVFGSVSVSGELVGIPVVGSVAGSASAGVAVASAFLLGIWGGLAEVVGRVLTAPLLAAWPNLGPVLRAPLSRAAESGPATSQAATVTQVPAAERLSESPSAASATTTKVGESATPPARIAPVARTTPPPAAATSADPRQRARLVQVALTAGGILVVGVLAVLVVQALSRSSFGPQPLVQQYLVDLQEGDASGATALSDPGLPNAQRAGLSDAVLQGAEARIDAIRVGEPTYSDDSAMVPVEYAIDGQRLTANLTAERSGTTFLLFPTWRLTSGLAQPISIASPSGASVAGVDLLDHAGHDQRHGSRHRRLRLPGSVCGDGSAVGALGPMVHVLHDDADGSGRGRCRFRGSTERRGHATAVHRAAGGGRRQGQESPRLLRRDRTHRPVGRDRRLSVLHLHLRRERKSLVEDHQISGGHTRFRRTSRSPVVDPDRGRGRGHHDLYLVLLVDSDDIDDEAVDLSRPARRLRRRGRNRAPHVVMR